MQLGMIGLGRMGANMVRRLLKGGHQCVVFDMSPKAVGDYTHFARKFRRRFGYPPGKSRVRLELTALARKQCVPVPMKVRHRLTTPIHQRSRVGLWTKADSITLYWWNWFVSPMRRGWCECDQRSWNFKLLLREWWTSWPQITVRTSELLWTIRDDDIDSRFTRPKSRIDQVAAAIAQFESSTDYTISMFGFDFRQGQPIAIYIFRHAAPLWPRYIQFGDRRRHFAGLWNVNLAELFSPSSWHSSNRDNPPPI
jgi:hypothetical protein